MAKDLGGGQAGRAAPGAKGAGGFKKCDGFLDGSSAIKMCFAGQFALVSAVSESEMLWPEWPGPPGDGGRGPPSGPAEAGSREGAPSANPSLEPPQKREVADPRHAQGFSENYSNI